MNHQYWGSVRKHPQQAAFQAAVQREAEKEGESTAQAMDEGGDAADCVMGTHSEIPEASEGRATKPSTQRKTHDLSMSFNSRGLKI